MSPAGRSTNRRGLEQVSSGTRPSRFALSAYLLAFEPSRCSRGMGGGPPDLARPRAGASVTAGRDHRSMQAALDRAAGRYIYARLVDDFHDRFVGKSKLDGDFRFECPGCGGAVYATAGGPPRLDGRGMVVSKPRVGHFAHYRKTCAYQTASAGESEEHRALKYFVADVIERCHGWHAALEVPGPGWRTDVHAEVSFDLGATIGRHTGSGREVVFEIQHTREAPAETRRRTALYERAGCEVVWLFDDDRARQVGRDPAVVVNRLPDGTYSVTRGVWCPRQGSPRVDLATFVRGVLDGLVSLEEIPSGPRSVRRWEWVWASDMKDLERRRRNHELSAAARHRSESRREDIRPTRDCGQHRRRRPSRLLLCHNGEVASRDDRRPPASRSRTWEPRTTAHLPCSRCGASCGQGALCRRWPRPARGSRNGGHRRTDRRASTAECTSSSGGSRTSTSCGRPASGAPSPGSRTEDDPRATGRPQMATLAPPAVVTMRVSFE